MGIAALEHEDVPLGVDRHAGDLAQRHGGRQIERIDRVEGDLRRRRLLRSAGAGAASSRAVSSRPVVMRGMAASYLACAATLSGPPGAGMVLVPARRAPDADDVHFGADGRRAGPAAPISDRLSDRWTREPPVVVLRPCDAISARLTSARLHLGARTGLGAAWTDGAAGLRLRLCNKFPGARPGLVGQIIKQRERTGRPFRAMRDRRPLASRRSALPQTRRSSFQADRVEAYEIFPWRPFGTVCLSPGWPWPPRPWPPTIRRR